MPGKIAKWNAEKCEKCSYHKILLSKGTSRERQRKDKVRDEPSRCTLFFLTKRIIQTIKGRYFERSQISFTYRLYIIDVSLYLTHLWQTAANLEPPPPREAERHSARWERSYESATICMPSRGCVTIR